MAQANFTHKLFHRIIIICLEHSQPELAEDAIRQYTELLKNYPKNPYDHESKLLDHKLWQYEQSQFKSYLNEQSKNRNLSVRQKKLIENLEELLKECLEN